MKQVQIYKIKNLKHRSLRLIIYLKYAVILVFFGLKPKECRSRCSSHKLRAKAALKDHLSVLVSQTTGEGGIKGALSVFVSQTTGEVGTKGPLALSVLDSPTTSGGGGVKLGLGARFDFKFRCNTNLSKIFDAICKIVNIAYWLNQKRNLQNKLRWSHTCNSLSQHTKM